MKMPGFRVCPPCPRPPSPKPDNQWSNSALSGSPMRLWEPAQSKMTLTLSPDVLAHARLALLEVLERW